MCLDGERMILYNNQIVDRSQVQIDIEDRGYQFGDGIYEVVSVYGGEIFRLQDHLNRFAYCAGEIGLEIPASLEDLTRNLYKLIDLHQLRDGQIYFQLTRGYAPRNHPFPGDPQPVLTGYVTTKPRPVESMKKGVSAVVTEDIRWLRCDIKSLNLLGSVLAKQKAVENGAYEAIQHRNGTVTEGSSSNLFIVKNGQLITHPLNNLILGGITRIVILEIAGELGIPVREEAFSLEELNNADEVFVSSTTSEVMPIVEIAGKIIGSGEPGPITRNLQMAFAEKIICSC
jgi:D-alanine transaminase